MTTSVRTPPLPLCDNVGPPLLQRCAIFKSSNLLDTPCPYPVLFCSTRRRSHARTYGRILTTRAVRAVWKCCGRRPSSRWLRTVRQLGHSPYPPCLPLFEPSSFVYVFPPPFPPLSPFFFLICASTHINVAVAQHYCGTVSHVFATFLSQLYAVAPTRGASHALPSAHADVMRICAWSLVLGVR